MVGDIFVDQIYYLEMLVCDVVYLVKIYFVNYFWLFFSSCCGWVILIVDVLVQLIVNFQDFYVWFYGYDQMVCWVLWFWWCDIKVGYFLLMLYLQVMVVVVYDFVDLVDGKQLSCVLLCVQVGWFCGYFGDMLVLVIGVGSGIGCEIVFVFVCEGVEIVISDIDEVIVKDIVVEIVVCGGIVYFYVFDVFDVEVVEVFVEWVSVEYGVFDIVVNNVGIGQVGWFLDILVEQFDWVLVVNLGGVVNGCCVFGQCLVEWGIGGYIVNVLLMVVYVLLQLFSVYCIFKVVIYMFFDCLWVEFDVVGVGLIIICFGVIDINIVVIIGFYVFGIDEEKIDGWWGQIDKMFVLCSYGLDKVVDVIVFVVKKKKLIRLVVLEVYVLYGIFWVLLQVLCSIVWLWVI